MFGDREKSNLKLEPPTLKPFTPGPDHNKDIAVLMSGGVDSSVTALLLKHAGWNIAGVTMRLPTAHHCTFTRSCCGTEAAYVCRDLDLPHYYLDVRAEFTEHVIEAFRRAYAAGRTPSPCVECNTTFKFGLVWDFVGEALGIRKIATGHYARVAEQGGRWSLVRAAQKARDQSYFLYGIKAARLPDLLLPLGGLNKEDVRRQAEAAALPVARRQDSMELCFAGEGDYRNALAPEATRPGEILDPAGNVIGRHTGIAHYTHGQRRGLGIAAPEPLYVLGIRPESNTIVAGTREDALRREVRAAEVNVLEPEAMQAGARLLGKIRSGGEPAECTVEAYDGDGGTMRVRFAEALFAPAPGQKLVLYDAGERVIAGGTIEESE